MYWVSSVTPNLPRSPPQYPDYWQAHKTSAPPRPICGTGHRRGCTHHPVSWSRSTPPSLQHHQESCFTHQGWDTKGRTLGDSGQHPLRLWCHLHKDRKEAQKKRVTEHYLSSVGQHIERHRHSFSEQDVSILHQKPNWFRMGMAEAIHVAWGRPNLNRDQGWTTLPVIYREFIQSRDPNSTLRSREITDSQHSADEGSWIANESFCLFFIVAVSVV